MNVNHILNGALVLLAIVSYVYVNCFGKRAPFVVTVFFFIVLGFVDWSISSEKPIDDIGKVLIYVGVLTYATFSAFADFLHRSTERRPT